MKKYFFLFCILFCELSTVAHGIKLEKVARIDLSKIYGDTLCESCIHPIAHIKSLGADLFLYESNNKEVIHYDIRAHKVVKKISAHVVNELLYQTPMFVNKRGVVNFFVMQTNYRHHVAKVPTDRKGVNTLSNLTESQVQDQHNITRNFSNVPTNSNTCYLNIIRRYSNATKADYYKKLKKTPIACGYNIKENVATASPINFCSPFPDGPGKILVNNFWFFDVLEDKGCVFFQNKCADTIYDYNIKNNTVKRIVPKGSQYEIKPIWFNPKSSDMGDILLKQNRTSCIYVDYKQGRIYRKLVVNFKTGLKHVVQILSLKGFVLGEKLLDPRYENLVRIGKEIYIYTKEDKFFTLYKVTHES